ncbi:hypothetical protein HK100_008645 [Physocladia obscura]|uniref:C2H2-type domain-containing protein n=1 Tax=Physocladia obscura TaxID=109957 RepID=A0AAD5XEJ0_9FUNG|nr:hypothetical protein HK100_008645 [Physocladia obscura]
MSNTAKPLCGTDDTSTFHESPIHQSEVLLQSALTPHSPNQPHNSPLLLKQSRFISSTHPMAASSTERDFCKDLYCCGILLHDFHQLQLHGEMFHGGASAAALASLLELRRCNDDFVPKPLGSDSTTTNPVTNPSDSISKEKFLNSRAVSIQSIEKTEELDEEEIDENMKVGFDDELSASNKVENMTSADDHDGNGINQEYSNLPSLETVLKSTSENLLDPAIVAAIRLVESMRVNAHNATEFTHCKPQMMIGAILSPVLTLPASDVDGLMSPTLALPPSAEPLILPPVMSLPTSSEASILPPVMTLPPDDSAKPIIVPDEEPEYVNETSPSRADIQPSVHGTDPVSPTPSQNPVISLKDIYLDTTGSNSPNFERGSFSIKNINNAIFGLKDEDMSYSTSDSSGSDEDDYEQYEDASGVLNSVAASRALARMETPSAASNPSSVENFAPFESKRRLRQQQQLNYSLTSTPNQFASVGGGEPKKRGRPKLNRHVLSPNHPKYLPPPPTMGYFEHLEAQRSPIASTPSRPSIRVKLRIPPSISSLTPTAITPPSDIAAPPSSIPPGGPLSPPQSLTDDAQQQQHQQQSQHPQETPTVLDENVLASLGPAATAALRRRVRDGVSTSSQIDLLSAPAPIIKGYIEDANGMLVKRGRGRPRKIAKPNEVLAITYYQMQKDRQQRESFEGISVTPVTSHKKGLLQKKKKSHLKSRKSHPIPQAPLNSLEREEKEKYEDEFNTLFAEESEIDDLEAMDFTEPLIHYETLRDVGGESSEFLEGGNEKKVEKEESVEPEFVLALEEQMTTPENEGLQIHIDLSQESIQEESIEYEIGCADDEEIIVDDLPEETIAPPLSTLKVKAKPKTKAVKKIGNKKISSTRKLKAKVEASAATSQLTELESVLNSLHEEAAESLKSSAKVPATVSVTTTEKIKAVSEVPGKKHSPKKSQGSVIANAKLVEDYESEFSESNAVDDVDCETPKPIDADATTVSPEHAENYRLLYAKLQAHQKKVTQESLRKRLDSQKMDSPSEIVAPVNIKKKPTKIITTVGLTPASVLTSILAIATANTRRRIMTGVRSPAASVSAESKAAASKFSVAAKISTESAESKSNLAVAALSTSSLQLECKPFDELLNQPANRRRFRLNLLSILPDGGLEKRYVCPVCGKDYKNANGVKYHLIKFHADGSGIPPILYGDDADDEDDGDISFEGPVLQGGAASLEYHCFLEGCENIYKSVNGLRYHVKSIHASLLVEAEHRNIFDDYDIPPEILHLSPTPRSLKAQSSSSAAPTNNNSSNAVKNNNSTLKQYGSKLAAKNSTSAKNLRRKSSVVAVENEENEPNRKRNINDEENEENDGEEEPAEEEEEEEEEEEAEVDDEYMKVDDETFAAKESKSITSAKRANESGGVELRSSKRRNISVVAPEPETNTSRRKSTRSSAATR